VRALFGQPSAGGQTFLSMLVAAAAFWCLALFGLLAPMTAGRMLALIGLPAWLAPASCFALGLLVPLAVGLALPAGENRSAGPETLAHGVLRGFPVTLGLAGALVIMLVAVPITYLATLLRRHAVAAEAWPETARLANPGWWQSLRVRWLGSLAADALRAWGQDTLVSDDGDGGGDDLTVADDDLTVADPGGASGWSPRTEPGTNRPPMDRIANVGRRVSSQELFDRIMREIASSPARSVDRLGRPRNDLTRHGPG
jgi:hypothetical protein